ncbi:centrin, putative [Theileria equi strain WA]|uniref:Centrin, putative n=1 Tax=Theileria equi strain WA TaxID=1537102 RepID=L0AYQ1_THEEQ|nr:centrin, putative [Theileria equi strain WA]AFZ80373.1 centrin, putative [Theileria equi strain WA]|eukprot:XP_004830039.1 centrin, putative [Theileria equi strain WA]
MNSRKSEASYNTPIKIAFGQNNRRGRFELRSDQLKEISAAFNLLDSNNTGRIDYHELKVAMRALGFEVKKQEVLDLIAKYDKTNSGNIDFENFKDIMTKKFYERDPMDEINRAFDLFDEDKKGKIVFNDLKRVSRELGHDLSDEDLRAMIEEFDNDRDGAISKEDFVGIMRQTTLY